ncbi:hypothetical protein HHL28_12565 [Aerophototrophica crusticola]|uniref:Uncharacterized protein n=1 Tax=Aerophototrophica crusticola TaxID=1709002 RepID=A0A858R8P4_9PROT|nr:hypothetical protein HHL28_12565 [Rhodospirillaceae bacterium B3]
MLRNLLAILLALVAGGTAHWLLTGIAGLEGASAQALAVITAIAVASAYQSAVEATERDPS